LIASVLAVFLFVQANAYSIGPQITHGRIATPGEAPYQVSLQWGIPPLLKYSHMCGGSVLNERWILTAGHCITMTPKFGKMRVAIGKQVINKVEESEQVSEILYKLVHKDYANGVAPHDIALLKLKTPLFMTKRVQTVRIPSQDEEFSGQATLTGWGSTGGLIFPKLPKELQVAEVPLVDYDTCYSAIRALDTKAALYPTQVCSGPLGGDVSACSGDSGGPLVSYDSEGRPVQVGIVSWGFMPCGKGAPSVYTRVSSYADWINEKIAL